MAPIHMQSLYPLTASPTRVSPSLRSPYTPPAHGTRSSPSRLPTALVQEPLAVTAHRAQVESAPRTSDRTHMMLLPNSESRFIPLRTGQITTLRCLGRSSQTKSADAAVRATTQSNDVVETISTRRSASSRPSFLSVCSILAVRALSYFGRHSPDRAYL